jgi:hypothetical protein
MTEHLVFSEEELEITELPEREEMLRIEAGNPTSFMVDLPVSILGLITL